MQLDHRFEATRNMAYGVYERNEVALIRRVLRPGDVAVDVGANVGYMSAHMAEQVGPTGKVYSFEPGPTPYHSLLSAKESNSYHNQEVFQTAVADEVRQATYYETENILSKGYGRIDHQPSDRFKDVKSYDVSVTSLTAFFADRPTDKLRLIKIDVEGHEKQVIEGLTNIFDENIRPVLITEVTVQGQAEADLIDYHRTLIHYGYEMFSIGHSLSRLEQDGMKDGFHGNVAWVTNTGSIDAD